MLFPTRALFELFVMEEIQGVEALVRDLIERRRKSHFQVSAELQKMYPGVRGLSAMSVRRYCSKHGIHKTARIDDATLDQLISTNIARVSTRYRLLLEFA